MALDAGGPDATTGLTKGIYEALAARLRLPLEESLKPTQPVPADVAAVVDAAATKALAAAEESWRTLSHAIALGVVHHLVDSDPGDQGYAECESSAVQDPTYWDWLSGLAATLSTWAEGEATDVAALKSALKGFLGAHPAPTSLKGVLR